MVKITSFSALYLKIVIVHCYVVSLFHRQTVDLK